MKKASSHPLRIARASYNLTIEQLANATNVSAATIWRAEQGRSINAESRSRLCRYFAMQPTELGLLENTLSTPTALQLIRQPEYWHSSEEDYYGQEQAGLHLLLNASKLATFFEQDWSPDSLLQALHILLPCIMSLPAPLRSHFLQCGFQSSIHSGKLLSTQELFYIQQSLNDGIQRAWQFYHTARPVEVLAVAQAYQMLVDYLRPLLPAAQYASYCSSLSNLLGGAFYLLDQIRIAEQAHEKAYHAAREAGDYPNQIQSRNWQAINANRRGKYVQAIRYIEDALDLIERQPRSELLCSKAHLLANWAFNAAHLQELAVFEEKLAASAELLVFPNAESEFDLAIWHQIAGNCHLLNGHYTRAIEHLHNSLGQLSLQWYTRRTLTLLPLAEAYARKREKEASLAVASEAISTIHIVNSTMLMRHLLAYRQVLTETFPHDQMIHTFLARTTPQLQTYRY